MSELAWPEDPTRCALYGNRLHLCPGEKCPRHPGCPARPQEAPQ